MVFVIVLARAALFLVLLPIAAYAIADIFLPTRGFVIPMAGEFDLRQLAAAIVFIFGFLAWAQHPGGNRSPPPDDTPGSGLDFDNEA